jgi:type IV secretory pathway VirB3-like protein
LKQQVLKALANPPRIFYVPYSLAVFNFAAQFMIYIGVFTGGLIITGGNISIDPLIFLISVCGVHLVLVGYSKSEPQLANIISAKLNLWKLRAPKQLRA